LRQIEPAKNGLEALRIASSKLFSSKHTEAELECFKQGEARYGTLIVLTMPRSGCS
jgi:hypothetical protein